MLGKTVSECFDGLNAAVAQLDAFALTVVLGDDGIINLVEAIVTVRGEVFKALTEFALVELLGVIQRLLFVEGQCFKVTQDVSFEQEVIDVFGAVPEGSDAAVDGSPEVSVEVGFAVRSGDKLVEVAIASESDFTFIGIRGSDLT